ncbi:MAG: glycosyltransferase family 2 protein [Patescibacteria group bacterium]|nr:glycosyltransferase family 2 protein [Patescibacteria group bacterium]
MKTTSSLSIFFPAYNEEKNIQQAVFGALKVAENITDDFEIIVVDDGSKDKTGEIIDNLAKKYPRVKPIHQKNQGYGGAVWTGIKNSTKDLIFFTDADLQFNIAELTKFIPYTDNYEAVFGYRNPRRDTFLRLVNAWGWKALNRIFLGITTKDIDCAFKLFKRDIFQKIKKIQSRGAMFSAELIYKMQQNNFRIKELPVSHYPRIAGNPTGAKPSVILRALKEFRRVYKSK